MINDAGEKKPALLVVTTTYPRWDNDAWPAFVHELSSRLTDRYRVSVLAPRQPGAAASELRDQVRVRRFAYLPRRLELLSGNDGILQTLRQKPWLVFLLPMFLIGMMVAIRRQVNEGVDVIHAHWLPWGFLASLASPATPVLVTAHGSDVFKLRGLVWRWFRRITSRRVGAVAVVSQLLKDRLLEEGVQAKKIVVAPMGVDLKNRFAPTGTANGKSTDFIFVGRLIDAKGPDLLMQAMRIVLQKHPEAKLLVVGDGPLRATLDEYVKSRGLEHNITFSGAVTNARIAELLASSRVCVMPGRPSRDGASEGLGLVGIEALGSGCRLVSGSNPALQGMLPEGAPASFVDPVNIPELASALTLALEREGAEADAGFSDFRQALCDKFDWTNVALSYGDILRKLIR